MQAGGHDDAFHFDGAKVAKFCKEMEIGFYQGLFDQSVTDPAKIVLRELVPGFFGIETRGDKQFVVMENLCDEMSSPCIMDCKLGRISWGPDYPPAKIAGNIIKADKTTSNILGFRISGQVIRDQSGTVVKAWKKGEGFFGITAGNIVEQLSAYATGPNGVRMDVVREFRDRTVKILEWFLGQRSMYFIASSVLYVYDQSVDGAKVTVRLIDFAHVHETTAYDHSKCPIQTLSTGWRTL